MDKSPVVYKRRRSGGPLSEVSLNAADVEVDPESVVPLLASDDETLNITPVKENVAPIKEHRKGWSDQPLPRKRTRSSTALGEELNLKDTPSKLFGTLIGKKGNDKGKGVERSPTPRKQAKDVETATPRKQSKTTPRRHASNESPGVRHRVVLHSPIEFVKEKQAMFAAIDAFELESEEEDPEENKGRDFESEIISLESGKGESAGESPTTKPEQSTQEATSTEEVGEKDNG